MARVANTSALAPHDANTPGTGTRQAWLNPSHVGTLLWMRWKLTLRGYRRGGAAGIIGLVFSLLFVVVFVGFLAFGTGAGYLRLPRAQATELLFVVLAAVYLVWIALPLLQYSLNEGLDVTKLQIYPVTRAEQMAGLVLATLMDVGTLGLVLMYIPIVVGWSPSVPALAITIVALALAYVHTVGISQLVLSALMGMLRSRRFRDLSIILIALFGISCGLIGQIVPAFLHFTGNTSPSNPLNIQVDRYLQYAPPGMAARAIVLGTQGQYLTALAWLGALVVLAPVLLYLWSLVLQHSITQAETAGSVRPARRRRRVAAETRAEPASQAPARASGAVSAPATAATVKRSWPLSHAALAIAAKDARYLWRDPQLKASLLSSLFVLVFVLVPSFSGRTGSAAGPRSSFVGPTGVLYAPIPTLIIALNLSLNSLGWEREALQMLYLFPVRPRDVFWGKNLTVGAICVGAQVVLTVVLAAISGGWFYVVPALVAGLSGVLVLMACGNVTSVLLPFRVREFRAGRTNVSSENGCLRSILSMVTLAVAALLLVPVAAALLVPLILQQHVWLWGTLPFAIVYGVALHQIATRAIAPQMLARAPEIMAATIRE